MSAENQTINYFIENYINSSNENDDIYNSFTSKTNEFPFLKSHRDYIEANNLGFGDRAFHFMWYLLLMHLKENSMPATVIEIGVFKGQVISLWALIAKQIGLKLDITGVTPLEGKKLPNKYLVFLKSIFSKKFKETLSSGNFYDNVNYRSIIENLFKKFDLDFSQVELIQGYSTDPEVLQIVENRMLSIIYIDGDHTYDTVIYDIKKYSPLIRTGGFLVMDDASCNLPGTAFWKGHQSVSDATNIIDELEFKNILNVGHNRVYQRIR